MRPFRSALLSLILLLCVRSAEAQAVRYDYFASTTSAQCAPGKQCPLNVLPGTQVNICGGAVTTLSTCLGAPATTYTNAGAGTPCPTTAQLTPATGGACLATADNQGGYGFWILPGSYNYFLRVPATAGGGTYGPYPLALGASEGCPLGAACDANYSSLAAACTAAGSGTLYVTRVWSGLTTQTLSCNLAFLGANATLKPANMQTVRVAGSITAPLTKIFDLSSGGFIDISGAKFADVYTEWLGALSDGTTIDDTAINAALAIASASSHPVRIVKSQAVKNVVIPVTSTALTMNLGASWTCTSTDGTPCVAAVSSIFANPDYRIDGMTLIGTGLTSGGDGLQIRGSATPRIHFRNVSITGFNGTGCTVSGEPSGCAGAWLNGPEDGDITGGQFGHNNIGIRVDRAFNAHAWSNIAAFSNDTYGVYSHDSYDVACVSCDITSNVLHGYLGVGVGWHFLASHIENNNTAASAGLCTFEVSGVAGVGAVTDFTVIGGHMQGTHEKICSSNTGIVNSGVQFIGGTYSSLAGGVTLGTGATSWTFNGSVPRAAVTGADNLTQFTPDRVTGQWVIPQGSATIPAYSDYLNSGWHTDGSHFYVDVAGASIGNFTALTASLPQITSTGSGAAGGYIFQSGKWQVYSTNGTNAVIYDNTNGRPVLTLLPGTAGNSLVAADGPVSATGYQLSGTPGHTGASCSHWTQGLCDAP